MSDHTNCTHTQLFPSFWRTYIYETKSSLTNDRTYGVWTETGRSRGTVLTMSAYIQDWEPIPVFAWLAFSDPLKTLSEGAPSTLQSCVSRYIWMKTYVLCVHLHACLPTRILLPCVSVCVCVSRYRAFPPSSVFTQQISLTWLLEESFISEAFPERQNGLFTSGARPKSWNCYYYYIYLQN